MTFLTHVEDHGAQHFSVCHHEIEIQLQVCYKPFQ